MAQIPRLPVKAEQELVDHLRELRLREEPEDLEAAKGEQEEAAVQAVEQAEVAEA